MKLTMLDNALWAASLAGNAALLTVLLVRRLWREFPVFTGLITFSIVRTVVLFLVSPSHSGWTYFWTYYGLLLADYCLQVALIFEIARVVLRPTGSWVRDARRGFLLWSTVGALLAAGIAMTVSPPGLSGVDLWDARTLVFTALLTCEMFLAMSTSANRLGLPWRSQVMAIGQGLTLWAAIALLGDLSHVILGWGTDFGVFVYFREFAYLGTLVFWTVALSLPEKSRQPLSPEMQQYLLALHRRVQYDLERVRPADKPTL